LAVLPNAQRKTPNAKRRTHNPKRVHVPRLQFKHHLLLAGGLLVGAVVLIAARNWSTVSTVIDNAMALNEGGSLAADIRSPDDFVDYLAAHPEQVSLVTYDVAAPTHALRHRADSVRALASVPRLLLLAEYARQAATGRLDPGQTVPVKSAAAFALPGVTIPTGHTADSVWTDRRATEDISVREMARMVARENDDVAADRLWTALGPDAVRRAPGRFDLTASTAPQPSSGRYLSWTLDAPDAPVDTADVGAVQARIDAAQSRAPDAHWMRAARFTQRLSADASFREDVRERLSAHGSRLGLRQQSRLTQERGPHGTAAEYADLVARMAQSTLEPPGTSERLHALLERPLRPDSVAADSGAGPFQALAVKTGASPGVLSAVGYARRSDGRTRVVALFMDGVPFAVLYHLIQTGIDKGVLLQLLADDAFVERVRDRLASPADTTVAHASRVFKLPNAPNDLRRPLRTRSSENPPDPPTRNAQCRTPNPNRPTQNAQRRTHTA